ncbi:MAG: hypothetical protein EA370_00185 [Wenzhouxiangella sp.]|nr:MAG: hypothetical protein EA370_00185 [Wenzhouxiangella sp.]
MRAHGQNLPAWREPTLVALVSLVQRGTGSPPDRHRRAGGGEAVLIRASLVACALLLTAVGANAAITGQVIDAVSGEPIVDARVRIQATSGDPAFTDGNGMFVINEVPAGSLVVTAVLTYDPDRPINYINAAQNASDGDHVVIALPRLPLADTSFPYNAGTSFTCASCHNAQHAEWQESTHSNAALNSWVLDLFSGTGTPGGSEGYVFRDLHDADDTGFCATCHAPLADAQNPGNVFLDEVDLISGLDGVTCLACHQMAHVNDNVSALHHLGNTQYRFPDDPFTELWVWGPRDDISFTTMRASHQPQFSESRFCASCHEYNNPDTGAPGQTTYSEWLASPFAQPGEDFRVCQDCHMPAATEPGPISSLGGQPIRPPEQRRAHTFTGATPATLTGAIELAIEASEVNGELAVEARVTNAGAGHHFPTGISIRNALLVIEAEVNGQTLVQTAGEVIPFYGSAAAGDSAEDLAGRPGRGFARILEGRINGQGPTVRPVLFIDAESVWADTTIPSGQTDVSSYRFSLDNLPIGETVNVSARLLYRRAFQDLVATKGWTTTPRGGPIEIEVANLSESVVITGVAPLPPAIPVPGLRGWALLLLVLSLALVAIGSFRPRAH